MTLTGSVKLHDYSASRKREGVKRLRAADTLPDVRPSSFSAAFVDEAKALWEPHYGRPLTDDEAR